MKALMSKMIMVGIVALLLVVPINASAKKGDQFSTKPTTNHGKKWRIGYYEGGPYTNYYSQLRATTHGLMELGWIEKVSIPYEENSKDAQGLWKWMVDNLNSNYIELVKDAFWSSKWDKTLYPIHGAEIIDRLNRKKDIDLMLSVGTRAGEQLANNKHSTPTMVISVTDAVKSKIINSAEDSGYDHIHATFDPYRYKRMVRLFHQIVGFKKLGIAYDNEESARIQIALPDIEEIAKEKGFSIVSCFMTTQIHYDAQKAYNEAADCMKELAPKVDAVFITLDSSVPVENMPNLMPPLLKHKIPTFAQKGYSHVKHGALMSISREGFKYAGKFHAQVMARILNGAKPRDISQIFEAPNRIAINLRTAVKIGYEIPEFALDMADEIYTEILVPEKKK